VVKRVRNVVVHANEPQCVAFGELMPLNANVQDADSIPAALKPFFFGSLAKLLPRELYFQRPIAFTCLNIFGGAVFTLAL
jgi:hypothetical protein